MTEEKSSGLISGNQFEYERSNDINVIESRKKKDKLKKIGILILSLGLVAWGGYSYYNSSVVKQNEERLKKEQERKIKEDFEASEKEAKERSFALTKEEFHKNIEVLSQGEIGLYLDDDGQLTGSFTVQDGGVRKLIGYTRKDGAFHCIDEAGKPIIYNKKWVKNLVAKIQATTGEENAPVSDKTQVEEKGENKE